MRFLSSLAASRGPAERPRLASVAQRGKAIAAPDRTPPAGTPREARGGHAVLAVIVAMTIALGTMLVLPTQAQKGDAIDLDGQVERLYEQGRYREAIPIAIRSLQQAATQFGAEDPRTARSLNNLAYLYQSMGRYEDALPLFRRAVHIVMVTDISDLSRDRGAIERSGVGLRPAG